ncbi:FtsQ-type POTRA domain-containing protein [Microbacterium resistens]
MRRPAPIPRPAEPVEPAPPARPADAERPPSGATAEDLQETAPIAPLLPGLIRPASPPQPAPVDREGPAEPGVSDGRLSPRDVWRAAKARRRTLRAEIRRFTQRSRRRRLAWIGGIAAVLAIVLGSAATAYSPLFALEKITVVGTHALNPEEVAEALSGQKGTPLALISSSEVKEALVAFPLIETYQLEAKPPHELTVRIVERTPVGVVSSEAGFTVVDGAGIALSTTTERPPGYALIEVEGGTGSKPFTAAGTVMRALPEELRGQVEKVTASSVDDVTLALSSGATVVWGSAEDSGRKALILSKLMAAQPERALYDVSSPDAAVVG